MNENHKIANRHAEANRALNQKVKMYSQQLSDAVSVLFSFPTYYSYGGVGSVIAKHSLCAQVRNQRDMLDMFLGPNRDEPPYKFTFGLQHSCCLFTVRSVGNIRVHFNWWRLG